MSAFDDLSASNAWDPKWEIPDCPMHSNPHIYTAYAMRALIGNRTTLSDDIGAMKILESYRRFLVLCEFTPGVITTWPSGAISSYDDAYGAGYLSASFAGRCMELLGKNDGTYGVGAAALSETNDFYRFLFFRSVMRAYSGSLRVGLTSQILYVLALVFHLLFTKEGNTSGHLLFWLGFPTMRRYPLCDAFITLWSNTWTKRGYTPKIIFSQMYLTECPWFAKYAGETWL